MSTTDLSGLTILPSNAASKTKPVDQGIILSFNSLMTEVLII